MSLFNSVRGWFGGNANTQKKGTQEPTPTNSAHEESPTINIDGALQVSTVWASVTLIVETIATLPLVTYVVDKTGNRQADKQSSLYRILKDKPNHRQTAIQFWMHILLNLVLRGNGYARVVRDGKGEVIALWPLSADQIEVILSDDGNLLYVYSYDNRQLIFAQNNILHICGMGNGIIGMSPLDYMRSSVGLAINAQNHTSKTFRKNARRPGILMSDTVLSPDQRNALKKNFGDIVTGTDKELYILEAQFKFDPLGMSQADIQLLESRQFAVQDLARWFGVPSVLINDNAQASSLGSSVYEIIQAFYKLRLRPKLELIEQAVQEQVLTPRQRAAGITVEFNLDSLLRSSAKDRAEISAKRVQNGLATRNEERALENRPSMAGGDVLTAQVNLMPVEMLGQQPKQGGSVPPETVEQ